MPKYSLHASETSALEVPKLCYISLSLGILKKKKKKKTDALLTPQIFWFNTVGWNLE